MRKSRKQQKNDRRRIVPITAKTINQKDYIRDIVENDVVFCTGPSGSGKSYIAAGIAANHIYRDEVEQIIVTRPLVLRGERYWLIARRTRRKNQTISATYGRESKAFSW